MSFRALVSSLRDLPRTHGPGAAIVSLQNLQAYPEGWIYMSHDFPRGADRGASEGRFILSAKYALEDTGRRCSARQAIACLYKGNLRKDPDQRPGIPAYLVTSGNRRESRACHKRLRRLQGGQVADVRSPVGWTSPSLQAATPNSAREDNDERHICRLQLTGSGEASNCGRIPVTWC